MNATFIPITGLDVGHRIAGGVVTSVRTSKSGKTVFVEYRRKDGSTGNYSQAADTRVAIFVGGA